MLFFLVLLTFESGSGSGKVARTIVVIFGEFYEEYLPKVFNYINYRVNDKYVAEDLTSTVFEKALTRFQSYDREKSAFSTWLFTIARNTVIDHYRNRKKEQDKTTEEMGRVTGQHESIEEDIIKAEEIKKLKSCISLLKEQEQEIISMKFGSEMTNRQIAGVLGISESNVGTTIYRTIRKLRDSFSGWQNEQGI